MPQAPLATARLTLVPLSDDHLEHEVALDADPEVMRYLGGRGRTREEVVDIHGSRLARATDVDGLGMWAGFIGGCAGDFAGLWMLTPPHGPSQPPEPGAADLGYRLVRRFWRQGLATEGARELVRHGFEELGLRRIFAQTMAVNAGSRATMAAAGLTFVRAFRESYDDPVAGHEHGEVEYEIRREDWSPP